MSNYDKIAKKHFNGKKYHNCTQAVLRAYQKKYNIADAVIARYEKEGGSHVDSGICGALLAAHYLLRNNKEALDDITKKFQQKFGSIKCSDLRFKERRLCARYVEYVASLCDAD
jgi:hypothetical protein